MGISGLTDLGAASHAATEAAGGGDVGLARSFEEELGRGSAEGGLADGVGTTSETQRSEHNLQGVGQTGTRPNLHLEIPERSQSPGVSMFRIESDAPGHARLEPSPGKTNVSVKPGSMLYLSAEDRSHADMYAKKKARQSMGNTGQPLPGLRMHEFKVDRTYYDEHITGMSAPQRATAEQEQLLGKPELNLLKNTEQGEMNGIVQRVDETKGPNNFGIPKEQLAVLQSHIKPGSLTTTPIPSRLPTSRRSNRS